jgi:hypothetical protein
MASPVFWISLVVVFLAMRWLADGLLLLASVELRARSRARAAIPEPAEVEAPAPVLEEAA